MPTGAAWLVGMPTGLAVEADGALLVADRGNARVLRIREGAGLQPELLLGPDLMERPWGLAVDKDGSIFVADERRGVVPSSCLSQVLRLLPSGTTPPANAKPAAAVAQAVKTPQPAVVAAVPAAESPTGGYPKVTPKAAPAFQPPERSKATAPAATPAPTAATHWDWTTWTEAAAWRESMNSEFGSSGLFHSFGF
eukprot:Skav227375  [mRNA]  locus=scaffold1390:28128:32484:- [translate_table: standard]